MSQHLLSAAGRESLEALVLGALPRRLLVAFDFDGTLAPIVLDPKRAAMSPATRRLLARVARLYPCAVISGRARADLVRRLGRIPLAAIVGDHGAEASARARPPSASVSRWRAELEPATARLGVWIEQKGQSLSVHYRRAPDKPRARRAILRALRAAEGARLVPGKDVVNVLRRNAPGKGRALLRLRQKLGCDRVLFVGDDVTDEDAFRLASPRFMAVLIGRRRGSAAPWCLLRQSDIDRLLLLLVELDQDRRGKPS